MIFYKLLWIELLCFFCEKLICEPLNWEVPVIHYLYFYGCNFINQIVLICYKCFVRRDQIVATWSKWNQLLTYLLHENESASKQGGVFFIGVIESTKRSLQISKDTHFQPASHSEHTLWMSKRLVKQLALRTTQKEDKWTWNISGKGAKIHGSVHLL